MNSSSVLQNIEYNKETKQLSVTFNKGGTYIYNNIEEQTYAELDTADSAGQYFLANIKGRSFVKS